MIKYHLDDIMALRPSLRYPPKPTKRILVIYEMNLLWVKEILNGIGIKVVTRRI